MRRPIINLLVIVARVHLKQNENHDIIDYSRSLDNSEKYLLRRILKLCFLGKKVKYQRRTKIYRG